MNKLSVLSVPNAKRVFPALLEPVSFLFPPLNSNKLSPHSNEEQKPADLIQKNNETIFDELLNELRESVKDASLIITRQEKPLEAIQTKAQIDLTERYIRHIRILKKSLQYIESKNSRIKEEPSTVDTSLSWFDMFRDISMRMNESWREELLAKCVAIEDESPGSISLKTLWNIGLLETQIFHSFALFLDSSLELDGYPIILLEREDLTLNVESEDKSYYGILIYLISGLIDNGLIQHGEFELPSEEPIKVIGNKCSAIIENLKQKEGITTMIRLEGYHCTDLGLDLYRLYDPEYNDISQLSFQALTDMLEDSEGVSMKNTL